MTAQIDRRARLSPKPGDRNRVLGLNQVLGDDPNVRDSANILTPLVATNGVVFPYTPTINEVTSVSYNSYDLQGTNSGYASFNKRDTKKLTIAGNFTCMNQTEARYSLASLYFFRASTMSYFGVNDFNGVFTQAVQNRGAPPPLLNFNAWGTAMFNNVSVLIENFSADWTNDVDWVEVLNIPGLPNETCWLPSKFLISATLIVQNSPERWRRAFNLDAFRSGKLISRGGWV